MNGRLDEFAIWSRSLSSSEISNIYTQQTRSFFNFPNAASFSFTPDVTGIYMARLAGTKSGYTETVTATATITEESDGLVSYALGGGLVGATTFPYESLRSGSLLPCGVK